MLQIYLINILIFTAIILLIALIVAVVQIVLILIDARQTTKELKTKLQSVFSVIDLATMFLGGLEGAKRRLIKQAIPDQSTMVAFAAGLKKGLAVLFKGKGGE